MLKIVVFDCGIGGELFSEYLEEELGVVEIIRVIDWDNSPYGGKSREEICALAAAAVGPYVGKADVVVLASYEVTVAALGELRRKYPRQTFVGFWPELVDLVPKLSCQQKIMMVASPIVRNSVAYKMEKARLALDYDVLEPEVVEWDELSDKNALTAEYMRGDLARQQILVEKGCWGGGINVVLLYVTGLSDLKGVFEEALGWQVVVIDNFSGVLTDVCGELGFARVTRKRWTKGG